MLPATPMNRVLLPACLFLLPLWTSVAAPPPGDANSAWNDRDPVGEIEGRIILPVGQSLTPAGTTTELPGMRPVAVALSPDGRFLVTAGKTNKLVVLDLEHDGLRNDISLPGNDLRPSKPAPNDLKPDRRAQISYTGLVFSPKGHHLYLSNVNGDIKVFDVDNEGVHPAGVWSLPKKSAPGRENEIPAGLAVSADGSRLYVCGSLSNKLHELSTRDGRVIRSIKVGMIPWTVVLNDGYAWVANRAGARIAVGDRMQLSGKGVMVKVEGELDLPGPGTVSAIDLETGEVVTEIPVGRQPGALVISPDKEHLVVANSDDDTLSIIDLATHKLVNTPSVRWRADDPFGASPSALAFHPNGKSLLVCLSTQNAVGVFDWQADNARLRGMIPTAWYPSGVLIHPDNETIHVANLKGLGSGTGRLRKGQPAKTRHYFGSLSAVPWPDAAELKNMTNQALDNYRVEVVRQALLPARPGQAPASVPLRSGEPSVFSHVVYIIRENRTYDQVLGDMDKGRGDPELCIFGEKITPNAHKLAREFVLLDNTYCSGILSADGHAWSLSAFANDYLERSFAGFPRSYPAGLAASEIDVMAWSPQGFLWSAASRVGRSTRVYGEMSHGSIRWANPEQVGQPGFSDFMNDRGKETKRTSFSVKPTHASVAPHLARDYPAWSGLIPDQVRADRFIAHMKNCEQSDQEWENLHILSLPNDHTSGTKPGFPTPQASVADNDLALGRIVEAVSHSSYWKHTCIIVIEDDPQAGWDHVSGFRTVCLVASPYTKRGKVISTHFNQPGVIRTIGLILGMPPLNQMDAGSTPLRDCFVAEADLSPYQAAPAEVDLEELNGKPSSHTDPRMKAMAEASAQLPLDRIDACDEDQLNRILWHAIKGPDAQYPSWAVIPVSLRGDDDDDD